MDIRYQPDQPLRISLLASNELLQGRIVTLAGRTATLGVDRPLAFGAPLRIDFDDSMILGEVSACQSATEGYVVTIHVHDAIPVLSDLARLVSSVMAGGRGAAPKATQVRESAKATTVGPSS